MSDEIQEVTPQQSQQPKKANGLGIAGFVLSLVSLFFSVFCIIPVVALILSSIGFAKRNSHQNSGLTTAGFVISIISLALNLLFWILGFTLISTL